MPDMPSISGLICELSIVKPSCYQTHSSWSWRDEGWIANEARFLPFLISTIPNEADSAGTHKILDDSFIDSPVVTNTRPVVDVPPIQCHNAANRLGGAFARSEERGGNVGGGVERIAMVLNDSTAEGMLRNQAS